MGRFRLEERTELFKSSRLTLEGTYPNPLEAAWQGCDQQFATGGVLGSCGNSCEILAAAEDPSRGAEAARPDSPPWAVWVLCGRAMILLLSVPFLTRAEFTLTPRQAGARRDKEDEWIWRECLKKKPPNHPGS